MDGLAPRWRWAVLALVAGTMGLLMAVAVSRAPVMVAAEGVARALGGQGARGGGGVLGGGKPFNAYWSAVYAPVLMLGLG